MSRVALVTGARGQVGRAVVALVPEGWRVRAADHAELDITDEAAVRSALDETPGVVINCAAFTDVDRAEREPVLARKVNAEGAGILARAAGSVGARLIHLSTDYVFDGRAGSPYRPGDAAHPICEYGRTKLAGEQAVLATACNGLIIRTAWVYAASGRNFVLSMLRLIGEREEVRVVDDQVGTPTWASGLSQAIWKAAADASLVGVRHWTDAGVASRYDLAVAIREEALALGILSHAASVTPVPTSEVPSAARRPPFSVLDKSADWGALGAGVHWRDQLRKMLAEYHGA